MNTLNKNLLFTVFLPFTHKKCRSNTKIAKWINKTSRPLLFSFKGYVCVWGRMNLSKVARNLLTLTRVTGETVRCESFLVSSPKLRPMEVMSASKENKGKKTPS